MPTSLALMLMSRASLLVSTILTATLLSVNDDVLRLVAEVAAGICTSFVLGTLFFSGQRWRRARSGPGAGRKVVRRVHFRPMVSCVWLPNLRMLDPQSKARIWHRPRSLLSPRGRPLEAGAEEASSEERDLEQQPGFFHGCRQHRREAHTRAVLLGQAPPGVSFGGVSTSVGLGLDSASLARAAQGVSEPARLYAVEQALKQRQQVIRDLGEEEDEDEDEGLLSP